MPRPSKRPGHFFAPAFRDEASSPRPLGPGITGMRFPMYIPKIFRNDDFPQVQQFIRDHPFALVVCNVAGAAPLATHLPVELEQNAAGQAVLVGHFARGNPQWKTMEAAGHALVVFSGAHHYVSSAWYGHENVPTWNYIAVHVSGPARLQTPAETHAAVARLMHRYEPPDRSPRSFEQLSAPVLQRELAGIVGFEVQVANIEAAFKLSQNRNAADHASIVAELQKLQTPAAADMAAAMCPMR